MRRGHQRRARVGHRRQAGLGDQADVVAGQRRARAGRRQRRRPGAGVARPWAGAAARRSSMRLQRLRQRHDRIDALEEGARRLARSRRPSAPGRAALRITPQRQHARRDRRPRSAAPKSSVFGTSSSRPRIAGTVAASRPRSGSMPAWRSSAQVRISGRPTSAVGSSESIALEQRDAERLALGAAGAVVGLLGAQVVLDLGVAQLAKAHRHRHQRRLREAAVARSTTATAVWKTHAAAAHRAQLRDRALVRAGLADGLAVEVGDLVGADHDRARGRSVGDGARLGQRQALRQRGRRLAGQRRLVDLGRHAPRTAGAGAASSSRR